MHLLLSSRLEGLVDLAQLEQAEECLDGCCRVRIGPREHDWHLHLPEILECLDTHVVWSIVCKNHAALLPTWSLEVQLRDQVPQEKHIGILVSVGVAQTEVNSAIRVQSCDHGEPRLYGARGHSSWCAWPTPSLPDIVGLREPSFVHVYHSLPGVEDGEHRERILLPEHQASIHIGLDWHFPHSPEAESHALLEDLPHSLGAQLHLLLLLHLPLDLIATGDRSPRVKHIVGGGCDDVALLLG